VSTSNRQDDAVIGRAFRYSLPVIALLALTVAGAWWWRQRPVEVPAASEGDAVPAPVVAQIAPVEPPPVPFGDITEAAGIDFVQVNGAYGKRLLPETMGSGAAFFDYDNDGDQDLLLINGDLWPEQRGEGETRPTPALYANDGRGGFEDVTAGSGLQVSLYGTGVAVADYDGDGWRDVFIAAVGRNRLFQNRVGKFVEVTERAGVAGEAGRWSSGAAFFDYDRDGDLDLFVANYVNWSKAIDFEVDFRLTGIGRAYGPPNAYEGTYSYLYRNDGQGRFSDVSAEAGIRVDNPATGRPMGKGLAVAPVDADGDGLTDLLVANDTVQNFLFHNLGDGRFEESGTFWGLAFDRNGNATGAMGADAAFYRNDDDLGFVIGNFANEMTALYVSQGDRTQYADDAIIDGIGPASRLKLSFAVFFFDYDLDGRLDLFQANGHVENEINRVQSSQTYAQAPQLFWSCGDACPAGFVPVPEAAAGDLAEPLVGRGAAYADIDADGDLDLVITQVAGPARLLRNDQQLGHHWARIKLVGRAPNTDAIGAWLELEAGPSRQRRQVMPTRGYLSQVELPVTFGLGDLARVDRLTIRWPDGRRQVLADLEADREYRLEE
jgi:hypothetical protein